MLFYLRHRPTSDSRRFSYAESTTDPAKRPVEMLLENSAAVNLGGGDPPTQVAVYVVPLNEGRMPGEGDRDDRMDQLIYWAIRTKEAQDDGGKDANSDADAEYSVEHLLALMKTFVD